MGSMHTAQLATAENLTTRSILVASFRKIRQIRKTSFTSLKKTVSFERLILKF
jgi:hypothetical protein